QLVIDKSCSSCGPNGAEGVCTNGISYSCDATHSCDEVTCGGGNYSCTNDGGWEWRIPACGDGCCNGSEDSGSCPADCTPTTCTLSVLEQFSTAPLPTGWAVYDNDGYGNPIPCTGAECWNYATASPPSGGSGGYWIANSDAAGSGTEFDDRLVTDLYQQGECSTVILSYNHDYNYEDGDYGNVDISVDGGPWQTITSYDFDASGYVSTNITSYLGVNSNFSIRFRYIAMDDLWWKIDNFAVTGTGSCGDS
ncbi:unnamed protein product, partial [marine sediment metagenome]